MLGRSRRVQDWINDYWNALAGNAPPEEVARLRAHIDPELTATIDTTRVRFLRLRPDPAFGDRLEGELMNAFAIAAGGTAPLPPVRPATTSGKHEPWTPSRWIPGGFGRQTNRRGAMAQLGLVALLLLTLIGGYFVYSSRSDHPAIVQEGTPVSTPTEDWTNSRGNAGRTGLGASGPVGQPVTIWTYQAAGSCDPSPVVAGDMVYVACGTGVLTALDRATGTKQWEFTAQAPLGGPVVYEDMLLVMDHDGRLYAIDVETGRQAWVDESDYGGAPVASDGLVVVDAADGNVAAIDVATGEERWRTQVDPAGDARSPAIGNGIVFAGSVSNGFSALDLQTGALVWQADTNGQPTGTAVSANEIAYIGSAPDVAEGFLMAFDAKTGELRWQSDRPLFTPAVKDGTGFSGSVDGQVTALDLADGSERWQVTVGGVARPPSVAGDVVYVNSDGDQAIYAFDTGAGNQLWKYPVQGSLQDSPALKDGVLYATTTEGFVYALGGADAIPAPGITAATPEPPAMSATPEAPAAATPEVESISLETVWATTGGDSGLSQPGHIAIAPDGSIWVADNNHHRFQIFAQDGTFVEAWGTEGSGDGQFQLRRSNGDGYGVVAFAPDGSFYVLDPGNFRVQKFDASRGFVTAWGTFGSDPGQFTNPVGLTLDQDGTVWVIDDGQHNFQHFDADGALLGSFAAVDAGGNNLAVNGLAAGPYGLLFVSVYDLHPRPNYIVAFQPDGTLAGSFGLGEFLGPPGQIAFEAEDRALVTDLGNEALGGQILVFDANGNVIGRASIGGVPYGVAIDGEGNVYTTDLVNNTLTKWDGPSAPSVVASPEA